MTRARGSEDARVVVIELTDAGRALEDAAAKVPEQMAGCIQLPREDVAALYRLLHGVLAG